MAGPNTLIAPFDAALPGTQPRLNAGVLLPALRAALALSCTPAAESRFDRKHYFYWDQPAGYQITQFYAPLAKGGSLELTPTADGVDAPQTVGIRQVQIEQDTGKTIASPPNNLVDLNRVGAPLVEIITDPFPVAQPATAAKVLAKIQAILRAVDACVLGMEWGGLRADVNVSVARAGTEELGQRCEIKNLSSFRAVQDAVECEARRQVKMLEAGGVVDGETRGWDAERSITKRLRGKEGEVDYRYMPDPDLGPLCLSEELVERVRETMPPLPDEIVEELTAEPYALTPKDARTLLAWDEGRSTREDSVVWYYRRVVEEVIASLTAPVPQAGRVAGNWVIHELGGQLKSWAENPVPAEHMAELVALLLGGYITGPTAKKILPKLLEPNAASPSEIVKMEGLGVTPMTDTQLESVVAKVLATETGQDVVRRMREANEKKAKGMKSMLVGTVMKELQGKVDARRVDEALGRMLQ